jgi:hypothetical protein
MYEVSVMNSSWENVPTIWIDQWTKGIKEPAVAIKLLLVLLFQAEDDLNWADPSRHLPSLRNDYV